MKIVFFVSLMMAIKVFAVSDLPGAGIPSTPKILNQILFYESKESWTARDQQLFEKVKKEIFQKITLSQFTENEDDDFLLSRLSAREGQLFEVTPVKACPLSESQHAALSLFSSSEIEEEMKQQGLSLAMINIKESQLKQKLRFRTWYDLLKRKYQVKFKSAEFKP